MTLPVYPRVETIKSLPVPNCLILHNEFYGFSADLIEAIN